MKKFFFSLLTFVLCPLSLLAGITTYTFTSVSWTSKVGSTVCNGTTDGWVSDMNASDYSSGYTDAEGRPYSKGVSVKTGTSGAGATSVLEFTDVRRVTFNFCQNSSKGRGVIYVQVGSNAPDSIIVYKPATSGSGVYLRDSIVTFPVAQTGKIRFWVKCTENAININSISIRAANGGSSPFTMDTYQMVTDVAQLQDSDQIIFGVAASGINYIMGYFDESVSVNNIHAIAGRYTADRSQVSADDRAIYTLRITELNGNTAYVFQDELRYEEAYLVASGGQTKNRLALWDKLVDTNTYGNYGYWTISIASDGEATITNLGNSKAKIIQYNASNSPTLFACYESLSQTPVCLYRRVPAMGDVTAIVAPLVNFGITTATSGSKTIEVNANGLTQDISASLSDGSIFSISSELLDRDGDNLTISYSVTSSGHYVDTLILRSGETETRTLIMLQFMTPVSIAEAVHLPDYSVAYLNDVVVTKKYDSYIYIRDASGSMLIFDRGNGATGKPYGQGLKAGDPLSGVTGRMLNYYGVPELSPTATFSVGINTEVLPEPAGLVIDSADVCRYLRLDSAVVSGSSLTYRGHSYAITNKFNLPDFIEQKSTCVTCIVSYDWDVVTLYIVSQTEYPATSLDSRMVGNRSARLVMHNGVVYVETEGGIYTLTGEKL